MKDIKEPVDEEVVEIPEEDTILPEEVMETIEQPGELEVIPVVSGCGSCAGTGLIKNGWGIDELCPVCQGKGK